MEKLQQQSHKRQRADTGILYGRLGWNPGELDEIRLGNKSEWKEGGGCEAAHVGERRLRLPDQASIGSRVHSRLK